MELSSTTLALGIVTDSKILIEIANKQKEGQINMCQSIDNALKKQKERGYRIGLLLGLRISFVMYLQNVLPTLYREYGYQMDNQTNEQLEALLQHLQEPNDYKDYLLK